MKISVIIPSYNPTLKLSATLDKLVLQSSFIDELIVVIDNDKYNDYAKFLMKKYSPDLKIRVFPQPNSGRAVSRNNGAKLSESDIILFLDDDMLAESNLIEQHIQYHLKNPGIIVSGNGYRNPEDAMYAFGKFLINMEKEWKKKDTGVHEITLQKFNFTACNMSLPKSIFNQLGGFDTRFSDGEDFDFAVRAIQQDTKIIYDSTLLAWHNDWPEIGQYIKRQNEYTLAKAEILKIHPEYIKYFPTLVAPETDKVKKIVLGFIRRVTGGLAISRNRIVEMLPQRIRFFIYQIIISSNSSINL